MADRVKQPEAAKMKPENKSYYDLFGDVNPAVEAVKKKYEESEIKEEKLDSTGKDRNLTDVFVEKYGNNLVGSKLSNAINEFSKDMGIQGAGKEDLAQSYIGIRKSSLTPEQVKSQFSEDVKTKKLDAVDYAPFLKEGYKKLESYGIKVPNAPQKTEKKKTTTAKSESPEIYQTEEAKAFQKKWESKGVKFNANGEAINPPQELVDDFNKTFSTTKPESIGSQLTGTDDIKYPEEYQIPNNDVIKQDIFQQKPIVKKITGEQLINKINAINSDKLMPLSEKGQAISSEISKINNAISKAEKDLDNFMRGRGRTDAEIKPYQDKIAYYKGIKEQISKLPAIKTMQSSLIRR